MRESEKCAADYDSSYPPDRCVAHEFAHSAYQITAKHHFFAESGERQRLSKPHLEGTCVTGFTENGKIYRLSRNENGKRYNRNPDSEKESYGPGDCIEDRS